MLNGDLEERTGSMTQVLEWLPVTIAGLAGGAAIFEAARRREAAARRRPLVVRSRQRRR
jgi:hypothetical protein